MVRLENVSYKVQHKVLLQPTSLSFGPHLFHVIMGANGAGKSTLLKLMSSFLQPSTGSIFFQEKELQQYTKKELATKRSVLSQHYHITFPITVNDIILMGRYPYFGNTPAPKDIQICREVMELMQLEAFSERDYNTLSGGEAQKVQMCRVLAQIWEAKEGVEKILFLDEPVSNLDVRYQYQLMQIAKDLCQHHVTIIAILHDINLALSFADRMVLMKEGYITHELPHPKDISSPMIYDTFGINAVIETYQQKPVIIFNTSHH